MPRHFRGRPRATSRSTVTRAESLPNNRNRRELGGLGYDAAAEQLSPGTDSGTKTSHSSELIRGGMVGRGIAVGTMPMTAAAEATLKDSARAVAGERGFKVMKTGGRVVLLVAVAMDTWEVYEADDRRGEAIEKAGAWAAAATTTKAVGALASPLLGGGPAGWVAYGLIVGGAAAVAYMVGGEVAETIYENNINAGQEASE